VTFQIVNVRSSFWTSDNKNCLVRILSCLRHWLVHYLKLQSAWWYHKAIWNSEVPRVFTLDNGLDFELVGCCVFNPRLLHLLSTSIAIKFEVTSRRGIELIR